MIFLIFQNVGLFSFSCVTVLNYMFYLIFVGFLFILLPAEQNSFPPVFTWSRKPIDILPSLLNSIAVFFSLCLSLFLAQ